MCTHARTLIIEPIKPLSIKLKQAHRRGDVLLVIHVHVCCSQPAFGTMLSVDDTHMLQVHHEVTKPQGAADAIE
jgi:hypothetical protein